MAVSDRPATLGRTVADQRIQKWAGWLEGTIKSNVLTMHLQRAAWRDVSEMLAANARALPDSYWWEFMRDTYATTQAVAVRRQADTMKGVGSLGKLVDEVSEDASRITRDFFLTGSGHRRRPVLGARCGAELG